MDDLISRQAAMRAQIGRMIAIFAENGQKERINVIKTEAVITHRCAGSLNAGISIRYGKGWYDRQNAWRMWEPITDSDWRYRHDRNQTGNKVSLLLLMRKDRS